MEDTSETPFHCVQEVVLPVLPQVLVGTTNCLKHRTLRGFCSLLAVNSTPCVFLVIIYSTKAEPARR